MLGKTVYLKMVCYLQAVECVQVNEEDESRNSVDKDTTVGAIVIIPQSNVQGDNF